MFLRNLGASLLGNMFSGIDVIHESECTKRVCENL